MSHFFARVSREMHAFRVHFSHVRVFSDTRNVQKRATKSDTSGHCLLATRCWRRDSAGISLRVLPSSRATLFRRARDTRCAAAFACDSRRTRGRDPQRFGRESTKYFRAHRARNTSAKWPTGAGLAVADSDLARDSCARSYGEFLAAGAAGSHPVAGTVPAEPRCRTHGPRCGALLKKKKNLWNKLLLAFPSFYRTAWRCVRQDMSSRMRSTWSPWSAVCPNQLIRPDAGIFRLHWSCDALGIDST